jgi:urate oxidase
MARMGENQYGKSRIRLSRITRDGDEHNFQEWNIRVLLKGDFDESFTEAENAKILPTDTMKNTVYSIARASKAETIEEFAIELGDYLLQNNSQVTSATVEIAERAWKPMIVGDKPEPQTFKLQGPELQTAHATRTQGGPWSVISGIDGLTILKTTKSGFEGYLKDRLTTLKPVNDRIFGTSVTATWHLISLDPEYSQVRVQVVSALMKEFAAHDSKSVQHTLFDMAKAALAAAPEISRITLTMPNLHHLLADLSPFGQDNPNHIFIPIDEPHGYIEATVER